MPDSAILQECQEYHNCFPFGGLEEATRTSSNYVDEDYPARPEIKQSLTGWGDNCGSESSTLETDVCVWRYAPLVVHATQEGEEENPSPSNADSKLLTARKKEWWPATTDSLPQVVTWQLWYTHYVSRHRTHNLPIVSPMRYHRATESTGKGNQRCQYLTERPSSQYVIFLGLSR